MVWWHGRCLTKSYYHLWPSSCQPPSSPREQQCHHIHSHFSLDCHHQVIWTCRFLYARGLDSQSHLHSAVAGSGAGGQQLSPFCELCRKRLRSQTLCWLHSAFLTRHTAVSAAPAPAAGAELVWHGGTKPLRSLFATQSPMMRVSNSAGVRPNHDWSRKEKSAHEPACAHVQIALFRNCPDSLALV